MECETCQHRNTAYPMQVRGESVMFIRRNIGDKKDLDITKSIFTNEEAEQYLVEITRRFGLGNRWSHWLPRGV
jgi:hypothetical protein